MSSSQAPTTVQRRPRAGNAPPIPTLRVLFTGGRASARVHVLRRGTLAVGRAPEGETTLALPGDSLLSRTHAEVRRTGRGVTVTDLGSSNGSRVDGEELPPRQPITLEDGALLRLGDTLVLYREIPAELDDGTIPSLLGSSPSICELRASVSRAAPASASVVLLGASGTGKGVAARALHEASGRRGPFVQVNCAAIPAQLAESQLFGHRAGAFTGASKAAQGVFRDADGGTLFLDEIGDLPAALQPKLLHAVEEAEVVPVGATRPVPIDVRIVVATSVDLEQSVRSGAFRGDLYARLAELVVRLPTLSARREDVLDLFLGFLGDAPPLTVDLAEALVLHPWPFNVRELLKIATDLAVRGAGRPCLDVDLLDGRLWTDGAGPASAQTITERPVAAPDGPPTRAELDRLLRTHRGAISALARAVGRSRKQVYRWLRDHDLDPAEYRNR